MICKQLKEDIAKLSIDLHDKEDICVALQRKIDVQRYELTTLESKQQSYFTQRIEVHFKLLNF